MLRAIRSAVSRIAGVCESELPVLHDVVPTEALVNLVVVEDKRPIPELSVSFEMVDCLVTVLSEGTVIAEKTNETAPIGEVG